MNSLHAKLKELEEELKKVKADRENLKVNPKTFFSLSTTPNSFQTQLVNTELKRVELQKHLNIYEDNGYERTIKLYSSEYEALANHFEALKVSFNTMGKQLRSLTPIID